MSLFVVQPDSKAGFSMLFQHLRLAVGTTAVVVAAGAHAAIVQTKSDVVMSEDLWWRRQLPALPYS